MPFRLSTDAFRTTFVLAILLSTVVTLVEYSGALGGPPHWPVLALASVELTAIVAFAFERWRRLAAAVLFGVFIIAFVAAALQGEIAARFILFAASAIYLQGGARKVDRKEPSFA